ncbi:Transcription initiation factor TFIID subunit 5 [Rhodotorula toruloides]
MSTPQLPTQMGQQQQGGGGGGNPDASYRAILDYLAKRGHHKAALALQADLEGAQGAAGGTRPASPATAAAGGGRAVGLDDFTERNAPSAPRAGSAGAAGQQGQQRRRMDQSVAPGQMLVDPPSWEKGYEGIRAFVENSLDIHRPELVPVLLPLFVHSYLDLVQIGCRDAADHFLNRFAPDHAPLYPSLIRLLASLRLPSHVDENPSAHRWRHEPYHVRMSERGWGLLLGWLQGGGAGGGGVVAEGTEGRGRDRVLAIINERIKIDAIPGPPLRTSLASHGFETDYHALLHSAHPHPSTGGSDTVYDSLKLGPAPRNPALEREVKRKLRDEGDDEADSRVGKKADAMAVDSGAAGDGGAVEGEGPSKAVTTTGDGDEGEGGKKASSTTEDLVSPFPAELPPYPAVFRTLDVQREVSLVREARKRIKLGGEAYAPEGALVPTNTGEAGAALGAALIGREDGKKGEREDKRRGVAKPSVCLFTVHDAGESLTTISFSEDSTVMATGFSESYIRLWSLNGKGLRALRTDLKSEEVGKIHDANGLGNLYNPDAPQTRKLIAHSGPIYSLSFDPVPGPSQPPRYLLSASADCTVRLWSLETFANLVVYRGHREPVWAVEWGPRGVYFATASRDKTARLWITDKVNAVRIFAGHLSDVNCLAFHPNSLYLATGSSDRTCRLWDVQKGHCVRVFVGHRASVQVVKISPDGRYLASASDDGLVILWSLASGARVKTFWGHQAAINSLSFSMESTVLVSGASDETVRVWDVATPPAEDDGGDASGGLAGAKLGGVGGPGGAKGRFPGLVGAGAEGKRRASAVAGIGGGKDGKDGEGGKKGDGLGLIPRATAGDGTCPDLLTTLATKRTPLLEVKFTPRNLCLAAGAMREAS